MRYQLYQPFPDFDEQLVPNLNFMNDTVDRVGQRIIKDPDLQTKKSAILKRKHELPQSEIQY